MSRNTPSQAYSGVQQASALEGIHYQCRCGRPYLRRLPEQRTCPDCRAHQLRMDARRDDREEIAAFNRLRDSLFDTHQHDWLVFDESHTLCWAHDLARRYRQEVEPRPLRGSLRGWL